jgi:hypothetical protein
MMRSNYSNMLGTVSKPKKIKKKTKKKKKTS